MPRVSEFFGIVIYMYYNDHMPPHFHAEYAEHEARVAPQQAPPPGGYPQQGWPGYAPPPTTWPQHQWNEEGQLKPQMRFCTACGGQLVARGDGRMTCVRCGAVY